MLDPAQFFKCLSDPTRLSATLLIFQEGELCVCELMEALDDSQPKISRHLAQLRNCGILDDSRRGQWVFYALARSLPPWTMEVIQSAHKASTDAMSTYTKNLEAMEERPRCC